MSTTEIIVKLAEGSTPVIRVSSTSERGPEGPRGASAYEVAVNGGFVGTEQQWLDSLVVSGGGWVLVDNGDGTVLLSGSPVVDNADGTVTLVS